MLHSEFSGNNYTQMPPYEKRASRIFIREKVMDSTENENVHRVQFACVCEIRDGSLMDVYCISPITSLRSSALCS